MRDGMVGVWMRTVSRLAMAGAIGGLAAACSGDSLRFAENPFTNPFTPFSDGPDAGATGSIEPKPRASRPALKPVAPVAPRTAQAPAPAPAYNRPAAVAAAPAPSTAVQGLNPTEPRVAATKPAAPKVAAAAPARARPAGQPYITPAPPRVAEAPKAAPRAAPQKVAQAETRRAVIDPRTTGSVTPKSVPQPAAAKAEPKVAKVEKPKVAEAAKKAPEPARKAPEPVKVATPVKPAAPAAPAKVATAPAKAPAPAKSAAAPKPVAAEPKVAALKAAPAREVESTASVAPAPVAAAPAAPSTDFRWPARGRVINGFGGAGANEGVNIAVPEGTAVKAAEGGTVAYAGSEVKGYGNLVLIRHDNGYVSAYAHNGEIDVKRGQKVSRGQTIAKSGQSGNVTSPQLHFEIRKGSTPVDPMKYLASN